MFILQQIGFFSDKNGQVLKLNQSTDFGAVPRIDTRWQDDDIFKQISFKSVAVVIATSLKCSLYI